MPSCADDIIWSQSLRSTELFGAGVLAVVIHLELESEQ